MNDRNEENLEELFETFVEPEQAQTAAKDIRQGERIFREHPAPQPPAELISEIKAEVGKALAARNANNFRQILYRAASVAAVLVILAAIGEKLLDENQDMITRRIIPANIWDSNDIAADDVELASLVAEVEEIESQMLALQLGENGSNGESELLELEMEYVEINGDFWKG